jgi:hypothetical protein
MELFSEIYGKYYKLVASLLPKLPLTRAEISKYVQKEGFAESNLFFLPKLIDENGWQILNQDQGKYISKLRGKYPLPLTTLEKRWIKAICLDSRFNLFFSPNLKDELLNKLTTTEPLYKEEDFKYIDQCLDGDPFNELQYQNNFKTVLMALQKKRIVQISFVSGKHNKHSGYYVPIKLEYSAKDNKFRVYCAKVSHKQINSCYIINMARIKAVQMGGKYDKPLPTIKSYMDSLRCKEPIVVEVSQERNALERFMLEFSCYEKRAEFDEQTGICTVKLYYQALDETELLIKILSFGPVVKVIGPQSFVQLITKRIIRQKELLA